MGHNPQTRARAVMAEQRWTIAGLARHIEVDDVHLKNVLRGVTAPCQQLRERLPAVLGVPLEDLLDADLLGRQYVVGFPRTTPVASPTWAGES